MKMNRGARLGPEMRAGRASAVVYFLVALAGLTALYVKGFRGVQSDGLFYYSYAVSLVWDGDLDLRNQYDHPLPGGAGGTTTGGNYFIDANTGKAFSLFNPGAGFLMVPFLSLARLADRLFIGKHPDPYDFFYQAAAGYASVVCTALSLLILFLVLRRYFSVSAALALPVLFLFATNWLFYAAFFAGWSHAYALFLCALLSWLFLRFLERRDGLFAALFGLAGGVFFMTRNFSVIFFLGLFVSAMVAEVRSSRTDSRGKPAVLAAIAALFFGLGALPQFYAWGVWHGSPIRTSFAAATAAVKPFGFLENADFHVASFTNLPYLFSNLFNLDDGLFALHPIYLVGFLGALLFFRRGRFRALMTPGLVALWLFWFADAAYYDNWFNRAAGAGFGHRRFLDFLPLFVFGAAHIWEKSRKSRWMRAVTGAIFGALFADGLSLLYRFIMRPAGLFQAKASFGELHAYLLGNAKAILVLIVSFFIFLVISGRPKTVAEISWQKPGLIGLFILMSIAPPFFFRATPSWERQRFLDKRGFFLMGTWTPYIEISGRSWSLPENGRRALLRESGELGLPAPLEKGDVVMFKLAPNFNPDEGATIELRAGGEAIGRAPLEKGLEYYSWPVDRSGALARNLTVALLARGIPSPSAFFYEGRVILKETREAPFGKIDVPAEGTFAASGRAVIEGWALADRGVASVVARERISSGAMANPQRIRSAFLAEAEFITGTRPDVERMYVLYPDIRRAAWRIVIERKKLRRPEEASLRLQIVAIDQKGLETIFGERSITWKN
jgi:hypothetical protein